MASLSGKRPKDTYKDLLQVSNANTGVDATLRDVEDGEGTVSALQLSTTAAKVIGNLEVTGNFTASTFTASTSTVTATGSTTSRTLAERFAETYNVKDFGAVGDGATDDAAAITAAIAAANAAGGGTVTLPPGKTYYCATGFTISDGVTLDGGAMLPNSTPKGTILKFALATATCVTLTAGNLKSAGMKNVVVQRAAGAPPAGSTGVLVDRAYNAQIENVFTYNHARGFSFYAQTTAGLGCYCTNIFTAAISENHVYIDSWPELRVSGARFGANGGVDLAGNSFVYITSTSADSAGIGPNTLIFSNCQFNQGAAGPAYWVDFDDVSTPAGNQVFYSFSDCHVENITTAYIRTFGADTEPNRFTMVNTALNTAVPMFDLAATTVLNEWKISNNHIAASTFTPDAANINGLLVNNNTFVATVAILDSPASSNWTASFSGNVWGSASSLTVDGSGWADGLFLDVFSLNSSFVDASGNVNVRSRINVPSGSPAITATGELELIAHRGFASLGPENTLSAFTNAVSLGCRSLEFDVRVSSDGTPVVIHDSTVDRTTDGTGTVSAMSLAALQALDAGDYNAAYSPAQIPTFAEVVKFAKGSVKAIYPEIKGYRTQADISLMLSAVSGVEHMTVFQSFTLSDLQYVRARDKQVGVGLLASDISELSSVKALGGRVFYLLDYAQVLANTSWVATCRAEGVDVGVWTVNDGAAIQLLYDLGVTKIMSNYYFGGGM